MEKRRVLTVREARCRAGLNQTELAKRVGLTQTVISAIECGLITVRPSHRSQWENLLQQPPGHIHFPD